MANAYKKVTLSDVARGAGTSASTASRVLKNSDYPVRSELRERVLTEAKRQGYVASADKARKKPVSPDIGVLIPNITNLFYPQTVLGIESIVRESGYNMLLYNTLRSKKRESEYLRVLCEKKVRGVILSTVESSVDDINRYVSYGMSFVLLDQKLPGVKCPSLNFDTRKGARLAMQHFYDCGHRKIAFVSTPLIRQTRIDMHRGYAEFLASHGMEGGDKYVLCATEEQESDNSDYELMVGKRMADRFISSGCDATGILCINDMVAFGVITTLVKRGISVPGDVSVIGFDDIPLAEVYLPQLTTVRYPAYESGRLAATLLMQSMSLGSPQTALSMKLEPTLIERDTVRRLRSERIENF